MEEGSHAHRESKSMNNNETAKVRAAIEQGLDRAESNWRKVGHLLVEARLQKSMESYAADSADSNIPGYRVVSADHPQVDEFIALVIDMRGSTQRLKTHIKMRKSMDYNVFTTKRQHFYQLSPLPAASKMAWLQNIWVMADWYCSV